MDSRIIIAFLLLIFLCALIVNLTRESPTISKMGGGDFRDNSSDEFVMESTCMMSSEVIRSQHDELHNIEPIDVIGGGTTGGAQSSGNKANWRKYNDWTSLVKDKAAYQSYMDERNKLIDKPIVDWSYAVKEIEPLLHETREYMLLIDVIDGIAKIQKIEASASNTKTEKHKNTFASINPELYKKFINIPALITGHTHPSDTRCDPFPSVSDIYLAASKSAYNRYAGDVVFCRMGVIFYGLETKLSHDLLTNNFPHSVDVFLNDIVMAHQAMRSWTSYSNLDYVAFFRQYRMFFHVYPTSEYVVFQDRKINKRILNHPIDLDLIEFTISVLRKSPIGK
jgi:hypothetical protein